MTRTRKNNCCFPNCEHEHLQNILTSKSILGRFNNKISRIKNRKKRLAQVLNRTSQWEILKPLHILLNKKSNSEQAWGFGDETAGWASCCYACWVDFTRLLRTRSLKTFWTTHLQPLFKADNRKAQITLVQQIGPQLPQVHKVQCHQHWFGVDLNYCESFAALKNKYLSVLMTIGVLWPPILKIKIQYGCNKKHLSKDKLQNVCEKEFFHWVGENQYSSCPVVEEVSQLFME